MRRSSELCLSLQKSGATPKASEKAWIALAAELEAELEARATRLRGARWVHASERRPDRVGQYLAIAYGSKSDSRIFGPVVFDGSAFHTLYQFVVAYWLDGLEVPVKLHPLAADPTDLGTAVPVAGATRVDRFVAALPAYHTGPKARVRFLESYAEFLEVELETPDIAPMPRWIKAAERLPAQIGKRAVVAKDPDGIFLGAVAFDGTFQSRVEGRQVLYWLDGLRCPPFYHQPAKGLHVELPHPRELAPQE